MSNTEKEDKKLKVSVCQSCKGWVRVAVLSYFDSDTKARNEFMREVAKYNLAVKEFRLAEWEQAKLPTCKCN